MRDEGVGVTDRGGLSICATGAFLSNGKRLGVRHKVIQLCWSGRAETLIDSCILYHHDPEKPFCYFRADQRPGRFVRVLTPAPVSGVCVFITALVCFTVALFSRSVVSFVLPAFPPERGNVVLGKHAPCDVPVFVKRQ